MTVRPAARTICQRRYDHAPFRPAAAALLAAGPALACSSFLVTRGASADGSVMITYTCDGEFHPHLERIAAADHQPGDVYEIRDWSGVVRATIPEVAHTYAVVGLMNEHQLTIGETTFDGRPELENPEGLLHYWVLMRLALMRARTAREAIQVMGDLVEQFGYRSTGESVLDRRPQRGLDHGDDRPRPRRPGRPLGRPARARRLRELPTRTAPASASSPWTTPRTACTRRR